MAKKRNKIDWLAVRQAYITSQDVTLKELADIFGISESSVFLKSKNENWTDKRAKYQEKIFNKTCDKLADKTANRLAKLSDKLIDKLEIAAGELNTHEEISMFGKLIKKDTETVRVGKLSALVKAVALLQKNELEKERLKLEKDKLANGEDTENKVLEYMKTLKGEVENEE